MLVYMDSYDGETVTTIEAYDCFLCNDSGWNYLRNAPCRCSRSIPSPDEDECYDDGVDDFDIENMLDLLTY